MVKVVTRTNAYCSDDVRVFSLRDALTKQEIIMAEGSAVMPAASDAAEG